MYVSKLLSGFHDDGVNMESNNTFQKQLLGRHFEYRNLPFDVR